MSETQFEIDELVNEFNGVRRGDRVRLATDGGSFDCRVCKVSKTDDRAELFLRRDDDGSQIHVWTQWQRGWLDPLVDLLPARADQTREPLGTLVELRRTSRGGPGRSGE